MSTNVATFASANLLSHYSNIDHLAAIGSKVLVYHVNREVPTLVAAYSSDDDPQGSGTLHMWELSQSGMRLEDQLESQTFFDSYEYNSKDGSSVIIPGQYHYGTSSPDLTPVLQKLDRLLSNPSRSESQRNRDESLLLQRRQSGPHTAEPPMWISNHLEALKTVLQRSRVDIDSLINHPDLKSTWTPSENWRKANFLIVSERTPNIAVQARLDRAFPDPGRWTAWINTQHGGWERAPKQAEDIPFDQMPYLLEGTWLNLSHKRSCGYFNEEVQRMQVAGTDFWDGELRKLHGGESQS